MVALLLALWGTSVFALSLGKLSVLSALGEPLRAEIDISNINAEEAASLKVTVAQPDSFKAAGLEYNVAMAGLQMMLKKRHNGQSYLQLRSDRAVNDPFVDTIIEVQWNSGRIVRDYTMLFDPPSLRAKNSSTPQLAQTPPSSQEQAQTGRDRPPQEGRPLPSARPTATADLLEDAGLQPTVTVHNGDTAGRIALAHKTTEVSLDQMLVALLRTNPDAFIGSNVHRIKAGAVLSLPADDQVQATDPEQASQIIAAQSQDFNDFRRKLAASAPKAQLSPADRNISGRVQAKVTDQKPTALPDKLTLSKSAVQGKPANGQLGQLAAARSAQDAASLAAELTKNIRDLGQLASASIPASAAASSTTRLPVVATTSPSVAPPSVAPASVVPASVVPPASSASNAASAASQPVSVAAADSDATTRLLDTLAENPILPLAALGVVVLLAGLVFYEIRLRKKPGISDSSFFESRMHPESFFGVSGGQNIDTNESLASGSSMVYSPSQMDAVDDVDPIAEADVYLAYGRDMQAEEILKDALRKHPERIAIHQKLLEIYRKREDPRAFESVAALAYHLTNGKGEQWATICVSGREIDPNNALYVLGRQPEGPVAVTPQPVLQPDIPTSFGEDLAMSASYSQPHTPVGVDFDLDFSLDESITSPADLDTKPLNPDDLPQAMSLPEFGSNPAQPAPVPAAPLPSLATDTFDLELPDIVVSPPATAPNMDNASDALAKSAVQTAPTPAASSGMLEFDLGSLSLDLDDAPATGDLVGRDTPATPEDPLATKLALAEEFQAIGDDDGARALIEEVIAEASGDMKAKAQRTLAKLK